MPRASRILKTSWWVGTRAERPFWSRTSALLRTGERTLAFHVLPDYKFEPVEVTLGGRFKDRYEIKAGLSEGDEIVTSAGFLIDAESRLKSALSAMSGHQHGTGDKKPEKPADKGHDHHMHEH